MSEKERRASLTAVAEGLAGEDDAAMLARLGYKQELRRTFTMVEVFGIAFSIISLLPSIASTLAYSIPVGPAGMVWSWFLAGGFIFIAGLAISDLGSAMPTSGGLYWWTHYFSSPSTKNALSFLVGYSNTLGLTGTLVSIDYGFSLILLSIVVIATDGNFTYSNGIVYAVFLGTMITHGMLASTISKAMGKLQTLSVVMNLCLVFATIIALPIGRGSQRNSASFIFGNMENLTTWPTGWAFMLAWLSPIWTISCWDSCVHVSEEASNAAKAVPFGILGAIGSTWLLGFVMLIVIAACINPDLESVVGSSFGQPMAQIYYDALGKKGAIGFMVVLAICQYQMGLSTLVAVSRQSWAFSRDGALPFSKFFRKVSVRLGYIPFRTVWGCAIFGSVIGLLSLIAPAAAQALFSLAVAGQGLALATPILVRLIWGQSKFKPGVFFTGRLSIPIAWIAVVYLAFAIMLSMFPVGGPGPTPSTMNYTVVINCAVWGGALLYYFIDARKWFTGPKITVSQDDLTERQEQILTLEGVDIRSIQLGEEKETIAKA